MWLALMAYAHPIAALNATDGYSILLTPEADNARIDTSILVSEKSAGREQSVDTAIEDNVEGAARGRRGLHKFAFFQYSDTLVNY